jgi:hypothetical protein
MNTQPTKSAQAPLPSVRRVLNDPESVFAQAERENWRRRETIHGMNFPEPAPQSEHPRSQGFLIFSDDLSLSRQSDLHGKISTDCEDDRAVFAAYR